MEFLLVIQIKPASASGAMWAVVQHKQREILARPMQPFSFQAYVVAGAERAELFS